MATTTETTITTTWTEIISSGDFMIQNTGSEPVKLWWGVSAPTGDERGMFIYSGDGVDSASFGDGTVFAKVAKGVGYLSINAL